MPPRISGKSQAWRGGRTGCWGMHAADRENGVAAGTSKDLVVAIRQGFHGLSPFPWSFAIAMPVPAWRQSHSCHRFRDPAPIAKWGAAVPPGQNRTRLRSALRRIPVGANWVTARSAEVLWEAGSALQLGALSCLLASKGTTRGPALRQDVTSALPAGSAVARSESSKGRATGAFDASGRKRGTPCRRRLRSSQW